MQGLHPPIHDLWKTGVLGDVGDFQPGLAQRLRGPAGGEQRDAALRQRARHLQPEPPRRSRDDCDVPFVRHCLLLNAVFSPVQ